MVNPTLCQSLFPFPDVDEDRLWRPGAVGHGQKKGEQMLGAGAGKLANIKLIFKSVFPLTLP